MNYEVRLFLGLYEIELWVCGFSAAGNRKPRPEAGSPNSMGYPFEPFTPILKTGRPNDHMICITQTRTLSKAIPFEQFAL